MPRKTAAEKRTEELEALKVDELRERAKGAGLSGVARMRKADLVEALASSGGRASGGAKKSAGAANKSGGAQKSGAAKKSGSAKKGATLTTRDHDEIQRWAEARDAKPATVPGTEHGDHLGVLRFDFPGYGGDNLEHVSWEDWFATFDGRGLEFKYQETQAKGNQSNFFVLTNPDGGDD